ncbi:putative disease resistance protein isoform X1 [Gossypium australe]|uniref:Putative disease resistance protein isoform X1 n=1 Tax=Gossypium australe TaxID=47621 RepID=A0A5B6VTD1_9ROSI|nr:putative disease resistance protein isoform X1 [Gossypium australe]
MGSRKSMESSGYSILQNLEENCLLERVQRDYNGSPFIDKNSVHMHDFARDMALHVKWKRIMVKARMQLKELLNGEEWSEYLEKVSLMYNFISKIPQTMNFPKFPKLTTLLLSHNSLKEIVESLFDHFPNLKILDLSDNPLKKSFSPVLKLQALKKLNVERTGLKEIPQGLEMLVNLRYLNLGCTRLLKKISTGLLSKLCWLQYLVIHSILKNSEEMRELNKLEVFEGRFCNVEMTSIDITLELTHQPPPPSPTTSTTIELLSIDSKKKMVDEEQYCLLLS